MSLRHIRGTKHELPRPLRVDHLQVKVVAAVFVAALLMQAAGASADDTTAAVAAGGIIFTKNEQIRMLEEVLEISRKIVRVRFRFLNESDKDIHTMVAFPLPPYGPAPYSSWLAAKDIASTFRVWVNGRSIKPLTSRRAVVGERDVTNKLREMGLSDNRIFDDCHGPDWASKCEFTTDQKQALENFDGEAGEFPPWKVAVSLYWEQTFPAGNEIVVEHEYVPVLGGAYFPLDREVLGHETYLSFMSDRSGASACLDEPTRRAIENRIKRYVAKATEEGYLNVNHVEYILATGRNWKGPIGAFKLRIKKETPDQIASLCFPGKPEKVSPTVYEFVQNDYVPQDRLVVYFYTVAPEVQ
ncbi:MAG: DUF4424 family protein [Thermodesulfobacteriota bacterium]